VTATQFRAKFVVRAMACMALLWVGILAFPLAVAAQAPIGQAASDEARKIAHDLHCPICEGLSVADSPSQLAVQMRGVIKDKLEAGESREQIMQYFVERYGENILMSPPRSGFTTIVWVAPYVAVVAAFAFLFWKVRRGNAQRVQVASADTALDPYYQEVDRTYEAVRDEAIR